MCFRMLPIPKFFEPDNHKRNKYYNNQTQDVATA